MKRTIITVLGLALLGGIVFLVMQSMKEETALPSYEIIPDSEIAPETVSFYGASDEEVKATFHLDSVTVELPELGTVTLIQVESGSGSLYTNEDESITLWDKGDKITVWQGEEVVFEGYGEVPETDASTGNDLAANAWMWESMQTSDGVTMSPKQPGAFTLTFDADRVSGETDCNSFGGSYTAVDGTLTIGSLMSTKMYCEGSEEGVYTGALSDVDRFAFDDDGKLLLFFKNERGSMTFRAR